MPVCRLCESEAFDAIDGLYYCQNCGTQSQDVREEATEDQAFAGHLELKKKKTKKTKYPRVKGKPWFTYEAFQWIIKLQVEFLIKHGVDPALKDVVFQLWYKYLQLTGIAFTGCPNGVIPKQSSLLFIEDAKLLGTKNFKRTSYSKKKDDNVDDVLELCSHFSGEEFHEDDDPPRVDDQDNEETIKLGDEWMSFAHKNSKPIEYSDTSEDSAESSDESVGSLFIKQRQDRVIEKGYIKLPCTLAFCYLGLLWLGEPVFLSDLLRWAKKGQLPYFQVSRYLPHHMKFSGTDSRHLCASSLPTVSCVLSVAGRIGRLLQLPQFPHQKWSTYTARFISDLHLPACLHGIVHNLTKNVNCRIVIHPAKAVRYCSTLPNSEASAMAFIVVALKHLYGIDDIAERDQVSLAQSTNQSSCNPYETVPLFTDWLISFKKCEAKKMEQGIPSTSEHLKLVRDSSRYAAFCRSDIFGSWNVPDLVNNENRFVYRPSLRIQNEESQGKYAQLFQSLLTKNGDETSTPDKPQITSFPGTCCHGNNAKNCFDRMQLQGVVMQKLLDKNFKYVYYPMSIDRDSLHDSYSSLLSILAARIEIRPDELQDKVNKLENVLFNGRPLRFGIL